MQGGEEWGLKPSSAFGKPSVVVVPSPSLVFQGAPTGLPGRTLFHQCRPQSLTIAVVWCHALVATEPIGQPDLSGGYPLARSPIFSSLTLPLPGEVVQCSL